MTAAQQAGSSTRSRSIKALTSDEISHHLTASVVRAWNDVGFLHGPLFESWTGQPKSALKRLDLLAWALRQGLEQLDPRWSLDLDLDVDEQPVGVLITNDAEAAYISVEMTGRVIYVDDVAIIMASSNAGRAILNALTASIGSLLGQPDPVDEGRRRVGRR